MQAKDRELANVLQRLRVKERELAEAQAELEEMKHKVCPMRTAVWYNYTDSH